MMSGLYTLYSIINAQWSQSVRDQTQNLNSFALEKIEEMFFLISQIFSIRDCKWVTMGNESNLIIIMIVKNQIVLQSCTFHRSMCSVDSIWANKF